MKNLIKSRASSSKNKQQQQPAAEPVIVHLSMQPQPSGSGSGTPELHRPLPDPPAVSASPVPSCNPRHSLTLENITPISTPIAGKKLQQPPSQPALQNPALQNGTEYSNYMPMSECSGFSRDSGHGTNEATPRQEPQPKTHRDESTERRLRQKLKYQKSVRKYARTTSSHRRSKRLGRSLSASSLSTVEGGPRPAAGKGDQPGHTYKVYDGDFLTKPGGHSGGGEVKTRSRGRTTRNSKHDSEHNELLLEDKEIQRSGSNSSKCECAPQLLVMKKKVEGIKNAILDELNLSEELTDRKMEELEMKVQHQISCLDKLCKERVAAERIDCVHRIDRRSTQDKMAMLEEIRKTEMRMDRSMKEWCEARYKRVEQRIQLAEKSSSDNTLNRRRHSFGEAEQARCVISRHRGYRDSGAFDASSNASNSDIGGGKTPSDSYPIRTPWSSSGRGDTLETASNSSDPGKPHSDSYPIRTPWSPAAGGVTSKKQQQQLAYKSKPVNNLPELPHWVTAAAAADDSFDGHGTVRRLKRLDTTTTTSTTDDLDNESIFGDNESVSQLPILTLPSESMRPTLAPSPPNAGGYAQLQPFRGSNIPPSPANFPRKTKPSSSSSSSRSQQFSSQFSHRREMSESGGGGDLSTYPNACDFEQIKRLDNFPPVLPPRGMDSRQACSSSDYASPAQLQQQKVDLMEKEALHRRIRELEESLQKFTTSSQ